MFKGSVFTSLEDEIKLKKINGMRYDAILKVGYVEIYLSHKQLKDIYEKLSKYFNGKD